MTVLDADELRALAGDSVYGGPYVADGASLQRRPDVCVEDLVARLTFA